MKSFIRSVVKQYLTEQKEKYDTLDMLRNYKGNNVVLQDLSTEVKALGKLTKLKTNKAISQFKKEFYGPSILDSMRHNERLHSEIKNLGTITYNNLIRGNKKKLLIPTEKVKISQPERQWSLDNLRDLIFFKKHVKKTNQKFDFPDRKEPITIEEECSKLIRQLGSKDFWGLIEDGEWSVLNRINTNYTNWIKLIAKRDLNRDLVGNTVEEKVKDYFYEKPFEQVYDLSDFTSAQKSLIKSEIPKLSFADIDIINLLLSADDSEIDYDFNRMVDRVKKTTIKGEDSEKKFYKTLVDSGIPREDIKVFSSYGNLVDITFQCDLMVKLNGEWIPIQVKSMPTTNTKLLNYDIGGLLVYPAPTKYKCGKWVCHDGKSLPVSFDQKYLNISC
jgi:hypothetical protein